MLQNIREHIKGWVAGVVIILVGSTFVLFGVEYYVQQGTAQNAVVAKVDGHKITEKELDQAFRQLQKQQQAAMKGVPLSAEQNNQLKQLALQALIRNFALTHAAEKSGFYVSLDQAKSIIMEAPVFQVEGQFSNDRFQQFMFNSGLNPAEFFSQIQSSILISQIQSGLMDSEFVLPSELTRFTGLLKQTRSFGYFSIPISSFVNKINVTDAEIKQFYSQNARKFMTPEKVKLSYVILSPANLEKSVSVNDQEIRDYYDGNPANFSSMRRWQVSRYLIPLAADASDADLAKAKAEALQLKNQVQKDEKTSVKPALTWLTQDQVKGPIAMMVAKLQQGDVSAPFRTTEGFNVIKLVKMEKGETKSFASVRDNIKKALQHQKVQQLLTSKSEQLSNLVYTNPNTLDVAAKSLNLAVQNSDWLLRSGNKAIFADPKVMDVVFSDEVLNQGNNSAPIELKDGSLMVLRVASHEKSAPLALAAVKKEIHDVLLNQQAQREAGLRAYEIQSKLNSGAKPADVEKQYHLTWIVKDSISRKEKSLPPALLTTVFNLLAENKAQSAASVLLGNTAYAVAMLTKVNPPASTTNEKEQALLSKSLAGLNAQIEYRLYTNSVMAASKIKLMGK
jgi:peptidyl-prolyl cis-trans isomerase D